MNVPEVFGRLYVVPKAAAFAQRHPGIELDLVLQDSYVQWVEEGVDLAIRVGPSPDSTLRAQVLAQTPRRLVASPGPPVSHNFLTTAWPCGRAVDRLNV